MKRSDLGVVLFMYGVCLLFYFLVTTLPEEAKTYPLTILACLAILNTCFLLRGLVALKRQGLLNDLPEVFTGFKGGQFFFVLLACLAYMACLPYLGFYVTSLAYLVLCMAFLRVPKLPLFLTIACLAALIYAVFTLFLKVPLPVGRLFA
ncbi:MAG: tripartite tricarboxylate transporter TctB family protein [Desulfovibrio sp.]|nr:tripartite tricarboxylate transporter TctB family protein [Desulfovibrio sp.]